MLHLHISRGPSSLRHSISDRTVNTGALLIAQIHEAGSLKMNTALEYSTRVVQEGGRRCKKSTLNDLVHLSPLRIPLMNPPMVVMEIN